MVKSFLAKKAIPYTNEALPAGTVASVTVGSEMIEAFDGKALAAADFKAQTAAFGAKALGGDQDLPGQGRHEPRQHADGGLLLLVILVIYVTMVYAPIGAWLVELFPARIRYTSMSLPYHIGNGWFGGFLPTIAFAIVAATGDIYYGLWYPIAIAVMTFVVGSLFLKDTDPHASISHED